ncbi:MAG: sigma-70 family RNA polymerase sigma factor [Bacteroidales bacterium]|nr:sigma-70 family RNA polymerase sigma factor [Bacteroidales bacterium]MCF8402383.1 sigma-70 family RNA polymerase sigma factor [Bacteroidales bacterium]
MKHILDDLINRCKRNEKDAQFEIYKMFFQPMYNTSLRIVKNNAEAEDIMQDSFLDAFRKIDTYTGDGNFGGWLRRIVVNNSIDALKKLKPEISFEDTNLEVADEVDETEENIEYRVKEIKEAMQKLDDDNRMILSLFLLEGYDHEEISQILDISYNATRTRYSRAKQQLLRVLSNQRSIKMFHPN